MPGDRPTSMQTHPGDRPACEQDLHESATAMPHVTVDLGPLGNPVYQVGGKSFVFFRNPRPDAVDPGTGEQLDDVVVIWVSDLDEKEALIQDEASPFFTTDHFTGHPSVLVQVSRLHQTTRSEIIELVQAAWLSRASRTRAQAWLDGRASR